MLKTCYCCSCIFILPQPDSTKRKLLDDVHTFQCDNYFVLGGIRTCLGVSSDPMFLWIFSNSYPLNLVLVRSQQAEIIIVKCLIQGRNNMTRMRVKHWWWWWYNPTPSEGWGRRGTPRRPNSRATLQGLDHRSRIERERRQR